MTKSGFGEHLKRERQMRGVTLDEICAATRIGNRFLEALENEDWGRLPGGVFNRGFVRAVARFLGLDEEGMVAECVLSMNEGNVATSSVGEPDAGHDVGLRRLWFAVAAVLVLAAAAWVGWRWVVARRAARDAVSAGAAKPDVPPAPASDAGSALSGAATNAPPNAAPSAASGDAADSSRPQSPAADAGNAAPAPGMLELKIEAGKATSVSVTADGVRVFDGNVIAGQRRVFDARADFIVSVKDAGAILMQLNGQTLPPTGPPGRPGNVRLTQRDLKVPGGAH